VRASGAIQQLSRTEQQCAPALLLIFQRPAVSVFRRHQSVVSEPRPGSYRQVFVALFRASHWLATHVSICLGHEANLLKECQQRTSTRARKREEKRKHGGTANPGHLRLAGLTPAACFDTLVAQWHSRRRGAVATAAQPTARTQAALIAWHLRLLALHRWRRLVTVANAHRWLGVRARGVRACGPTRPRTLGMKTRLSGVGRKSHISRHSSTNSTARMAMMKAHASYLPSARVQLREVGRVRRAAHPAKQCPSARMQGTRGQEDTPFPSAAPCRPAIGRARLCPARAPLEEEEVEDGDERGRQQEHHEYPPELPASATHAGAAVC
jgi:hypothetical protein